MATRNKAILHHLPVRLLKTIYFKQMKMHFNVAGSSQLKRVKAEKLLQQKYLSFGFFGSCAFSTSQQSEFPYPLFSLAVGLKEVISLAPSGFFFFPFKEILGSLNFHYFHYLYFVYFPSVWLFCSVSFTLACIKDSSLESLFVAEHIKGKGFPEINIVGYTSSKQPELLFYVPLTSSDKLCFSIYSC